MVRTCDKRLHSGRQQGWWTYHSSLPTDVTTCSATSVVCPRKLLFGKPCNCAPTSLTVTVQLRNGSVLEAALDGRGCSRLKRISEPPSVSPTSQPKTGQTGDRYDPPLVLRTSEWVSDSLIQERMSVNVVVVSMVGISDWRDRAEFVGVKEMHSWVSYHRTNYIRGNILRSRAAFWAIYSVKKWTPGRKIQ